MIVLKKRSTWFKLLEAEKRSREDVLLIQGTMNRETERLEKKLTQLESKILEAQEANQKFFYKKERELKDQVQLGIIDHKEFHFSLRLLQDIEKALK